MMPDSKIEPFEVVDIATGRRWMPALVLRRSYSVTAYDAKGLKKDGTPRYTASFSTRHEVVLPPEIYVHLTMAAPYDPEREERATLERSTIAISRQNTADAEARLLGIYRELLEQDGKRAP